MSPTLDQLRTALSEAAHTETAAVRAFLAAGPGRAEAAALAALDQAQAQYQATRRAFDAAATVDDLARRYRRATRALAAADAAELDGPLLEAFQDQAADAYSRYVTATGHEPDRDHL